MSDAKRVKMTASVGQPAADIIVSRMGDLKPRVGIVLGSGLGGVADAIQDKVVIPYGELEGFPVSSVSGHAGNLVLGKLEGVHVACLQGRVHLYEGTSAAKLRVPIYALKLVGCEAFVVTSAVGSLREDVGPGALVALTDHINMQGQNPLIGPNDPIGDRFPSLLNAYDPDLREALLKIAKRENITLHEGVYLATLGPSFETPAEIRAFKILGADVVGMSMVGEVTCARHCGLKVAAITTVVNLASGLTKEHITHHETLKYTSLASENMKKLISEFVKDQFSS